MKEVLNNGDVTNDIKENVYLKTPIFEKFEKLNELKLKGGTTTDSIYNDTYNSLYQDIIQIGEFKNNSTSKNVAVKCSLTTVNPNHNPNEILDKI